MPEPRNLLTDIQSELAEIPLKSINCAGRIRQELGNISELELSIKQKGLIHPIAVMKYENTYEGFDYYLLVGGRRMEACKRIGLETIKAHVYPSDLNAFEIKSIELEENIKRKDMTDGERLIAQNKLLELWEDMYGVKQSTDPKAAGISQRDAADKLGISTGKLSEDRELGRWLEKVPALRKLPNRAAIKKAIDKAKKKVRTKEALSKIQETTKPEESQLDRLVRSYLVGDFFEKVKEIPDGSIQFIDFDIDFPMELDFQHGKSKDDRASGDYNTITKKDYPHIMQEALLECNRVMSEGWIIIWFGFEYFEKIQNWAKKAGFKTTFYHGKWYKGQGRGHTRNPYDTLNHTVEPFFYFKKGNAKIETIHDDVFNCPPDSKKISPFQKPIALMKEILTVFCQKESRILVPFAGSGNTLIAAYRHDCKAIGIDKSQQYRDEFEVYVKENIG